METLKKIEHLSSDTSGRLPEPPRAIPLALRPARFLFGTLGYIFPRPAARVAYRFFSTLRIRAKHKSSDELLESARVFEFLYGREMLKGYEWGSGEKVVLLVHGWESRGTALRAFVPPLLNKGFRVVAFDGPAHGNSDGRRTNLLHFGGAVRAVLNQAGGAYGIITHSFGGASTVFTLSQLDPSIRVEKLVLIGVPNSIDKVLNDAIETLNVPPPAARHFFRYIERKVQFPVEHANLSRANGLMQVRRSLIVHDKQDAVVPFAEGMATFEAWDNASMLASDGLGHYLLMKDSGVIQRVADFVGEE